MQVINNITELKKIRQTWITKVALIPTMGNLHEGHLTLIRQAKQLADKTIVSIFVNPLQFAPHEDFDSYPRTTTDDLNKLKKIGVDLVFIPTEQELYPNGRQQQTQVFVPEVSKLLCGISRPHFFQGVTTIVTKLFNLVRPNIAIFGEKDFQQLVIIKQLVMDLNMGIDIIGSPIVREADGLAMSSRNQYLSEQERFMASHLFNQLQSTAKKISQGSLDFEVLTQQASTLLNRSGFNVDYYEIRAMDLSTPSLSAHRFIILAAAWLGKTRLIDNLQVEYENKTD